MIHKSNRRKWQALGIFALFLGFSLGGSIIPKVDAVTPIIPTIPNCTFPKEINDQIKALHALAEKLLNDQTLIEARLLGQNTWTVEKPPFTYKCLTEAQKGEIQKVLFADKEWYKIWAFPNLGGLGTSLWMKVSGRLTTVKGLLVEANAEILKYALTCDPKSPQRIKDLLTGATNELNAVKKEIELMKAAITYVKTTLIPKLQKMIDGMDQTCAPAPMPMPMPMGATGTTPMTATMTNDPMQTYYGNAYTILSTLKSMGTATTTPPQR